MSALKPCPHCGSTGGFVVHGQANGPILTFFDGDGRYLELDQDKVYSINSNTVRCADCHKVRRDVVDIRGAIFLRPGY